MADDNSSHGPPALLLAGVKEDHAPEHVEQDDGHGHESWRGKISVMQDKKNFLLHLHFLKLHHLNPFNPDEEEKEKEIFYTGFKQTEGGSVPEDRK